MIRPDAYSGLICVQTVRKGNSLPTRTFCMFFLSSVDFFQNQLFWKILSGTPSECLTDQTQVMTDVLAALICVQTVCR